MVGFLFEMYYIYILYSEKHDLYYCGSSEDPWRRLQEHNTSPRNTFTSKYRPWALKAVFQAGDSRAEAEKYERFLKKQKSRRLIEKLVDPEFIPQGLLAQLVRVPHLRD